MGKNIPTVFIIFGATGDLISKKIIPALFYLYQKDKLPKLIRIVGFSRRDYSDKAFQSHIRSLLGKKNIERFISLFSYHRGNFNESASYKNLAKNLGRVDEGWTRIIVEKPFGKDLKTAQELDLLLAKLFKEEQIYRIDHYLAKEMLQNILTFRFANNFLEQSWSSTFIEQVDIRLLEKLGVEKRGSFYDGVGVFRDVGQNHLLQMLALITMEHPINFDAHAVRFKRSQILSTLQIPSFEEVKNFLP